MPTWDTRKDRLTATPALAVPLEVSVRTSERLIFSSLKYGPSVTSGRTTQPPAATTAAVVEPLVAAAVTFVAAPDATWGRARGWAIALATALATSDERAFRSVARRSIDAVLDG